MWRIEASRMSSTRQREQALRLPQLGKESTNFPTAHSGATASSRRSARNGLPLDLQSQGSRETVAMAPRLKRIRGQRTATWPSVQYRLWLEASNLLPYCPILDRPSKDAAAWKAELSKTQKSSKEGPCIARRPHRKNGFPKPDKEKQPEGISLQLSQHDVVYADHLLGDNNEPQNWFHAEDFSKPRDIPLSRLPSRMGRHSLEQYMELCHLEKNTTPANVNTRAGEHNPNERPGSNPRPLSGMHCQMLQLRTRIRNPKIGADGKKSRNTKDGEYQVVATSKGQFYRNALIAGHLLFSDVSPPPSPPDISPLCRRMYSTK